MTDIIDSQCPSLAHIEGERILIFGGSGSLGTNTIKKWVPANTIINVSRDEEKQWILRNAVANSNLSQIVGDISNQEDVINSILSSKPTIICIFACLKHIDLCEKFPKKSVEINTNGVINVHNVLQRFNTDVKTVLYVSTDKACLPITTYGCSKAIAEFYVQGIKYDKTKWVSIRYGNVLNSSGSILPYLQSNKDKDRVYTLTDENMTRFIMTLDQSVNLIEYALTYGKHNEIIVPLIKSMKIKELFNIFCEKYSKQMTIIGLRCREKIHEDLISVTEAKCSYINNGYVHITQSEQKSSVAPLDSSMVLVDQSLLKSYLIGEGLI